MKLVIRFILKSNNVVPKPSHAVVKKNNVSKPNGIFEASKGKRCENAERRNPRGLILSWNSPRLFRGREMTLF